MKSTGKIPSLALGAILIAGVAAVTLGYLALRLARYEQGMRHAEIKSSVSAQAELLSRNCRLLLNQHKQQLIESLNGVNVNQNGLSELRFSSPFIADAFMADRNGALLIPQNDQIFNRRFYNLFFEAVSSTHRESKQYTTQNKQKSSSKFNLYSSRNAAEDYSVAKNKPPAIQQNEPLRLTGKDRMTSRFGRLTANKISGWIPWFNDNSFRPVVWSFNRHDRTKIVGAEIETIALLARLQVLMPGELPENWRLEVIDGSDQLVYASGWTDQNDANDENGVLCVASYPIWREDFPGWRVRACLASGWDSAAIFTVTAVTQVLSLLLVIITAGFLIFYLMRRELKQAGQKTSFVANVSHELKTPLTSIRMYAEMLNTRQQQLTDKKRNHYLSIILSESERLSRLIANVLDFSRTEAGRKQYRVELFVINELIEDVIAVWREEMDVAEILLSCELPSSEIMVRIDRDSLVQVMHNLISNALKYASSGGELNIACHTDSNDRIIVEVRDRGKGIISSARKRIFNKFYRCDNSLTAETSGSGLGLPIARKLIRDQGGDLIYLSRQGGGSIFKIILPA
jgi:signal transduction histidine kinase